MSTAHSYPLYLVAFTGPHGKPGGFVGSAKLPNGVTPGIPECRELLERLFPRYRLISPLESVGPNDKPIYVTLWPSPSVNGADGRMGGPFMEWAIIPPSP